MSEKLNNNITVKLICFIIAAILAIVAGIQFYDHRTYKETVVVSDSFTEKKMLSDYVPSLKNTMADTPVFFFDSGVEGGTVLYLGGTHPYEPAASLSAFVMMENINVEKGGYHPSSELQRNNPWYAWECLPSVLPRRHRMGKCKV